MRTICEISIQRIDDKDCILSLVLHNQEDDSQNILTYILQDADIIHIKDGIRKHIADFAKEVFNTIDK